MGRPKNNSREGTLWYKDAVIYELHVRAFCDGNGDGIGDFRGLTSKLDYLKNLGINAIWLLPFFPSPLRDDGYDIADYFNIHPDYGTLNDFRRCVQEAHERGIKIIAELVLNHTSSDHAWFQRARRAEPGTQARDYYVWSDTPTRYPDARIIFQDFETSNWSWDSIAQAYYWHRFFSHQPDLNYENPAVRKEMFKAIDFWFEQGVDGLRLDAVPYLFEREGTNCENLPQTHIYLKELRKHVDRHYRDRMLLAEANQWPEDAVEYFGTGDECHMAFHFPLMPRLFMAAQMEDSFPIIDILKSTPTIPGTCQWGMFLRNHDELTLEMVTDEERDYMNRVYARDPKMRINLGIRRRLAPLLNNNRRKIELMNILLFSFPGTPIIYYGDEIGMGDNYYLGDRNGVRTPMQWNGGKNAGFSNANPQKLFLPTIIDPQYHFETINVENQEENLSSPLWWMRRVIAMRKRYNSFGRGDLKFISCDNSKVLAFLRTYQDERILVAINLSRYSQVVSLELSKMSGYVPEEVFSRNPFPVIGKEPFVLTFSPYGHFWLLLTKKENDSTTDRFVARQGTLPEMSVRGAWSGIFMKPYKEILESSILPAYLRSCVWFNMLKRRLHNVEIVENFIIDGASILIVKANFREGAEEMYMLPLQFTEDNFGGQKKCDSSRSLLCNLRVNGKRGFLCEAVYTEHLQKKVLQFITKKRKVTGKHGCIAVSHSKRLRSVLKGIAGFSSRFVEGKKGGASVKYEDIFFMKMYRKLEIGTHPEQEMMRFLSDKTVFSHSPLFYGALEYRQKRSEPVTLALLQEFIGDGTNAWNYFLDVSSQFFENVEAEKPGLSRNLPLSSRRIPLCDVPDSVQNQIGAAYLEMAELLGKRTAEMHRALGSSPQTVGFAAMNYSLLYQRSIFQSMRSLCSRALILLEKRKDVLPDVCIKTAEEVIRFSNKIVDVLKRITEKKISGMKIRIHGHLNLEKVFYTGKNFIFVDFEGDPLRHFSERKLCYSPLRDVAGMMRSFHYAAYGTILRHDAHTLDDISKLDIWAETWRRYMGGVYLDAYYAAMEGSPIIPRTPSERETLLRAFLLEKMLMQVEFDVINRPVWAIIPLKGILSLVSEK